MVKVILNPRYKVVDVQETDEGERIYTIKTCEDEDSSSHVRTSGRGSEVG